MVPYMDIYMLNMNNPQAKYEISWSYLYLNIMFTMF